MVEPALRRARGVHCGVDDDEGEREGEVVPGIVVLVELRGLREAEVGRRHYNGLGTFWHDGRRLLRTPAAAHVVPDCCLRCPRDRSLPTRPCRGGGPRRRALHPRSDCGLRPHGHARKLLHRLRNALEEAVREALLRPLALLLLVLPVLVDGEGELVDDTARVGLLPSHCLSVEEATGGRVALESGLYLLKPSLEHLSLGEDLTEVALVAGLVEEEVCHVEAGLQGGRDAKE
mmetsp:Transcript_7752/g.32656  ORF Transcript_7752/g.32656 Transcript_7752/m.32656 type:complete len:232 (-) Transcript_7752:1095-1790(-)